MFLQIDDELAINVDKIEAVVFVEDNTVEIYCQDEEPYIIAEEGDVEKFKQWWEEKADVYKL